MARSSYIYVLRYIDSGCIRGAWTVKYELAEWVASDRKYYEKTHEVVRMKDGKGEEGKTTMDWKDVK